MFLAANPVDLSRTGLDEEAREIEASIRGARYRDAFALQTRWAVRPEDVIHALNDHQPVVVHFSGHGAGAHGIILQDDDGTGIPVTGDDLKQLFMTSRNGIRLVILNACFSQEQARAIAGVIDCVIGIVGSIEDNAARRFTTTFYGALASGRSIRDAFEQGMAVYQIRGKTECAAGPTLLTAEAVDTSQIFLVK